MFKEVKTLAQSCTTINWAKLGFKCTQVCLTPEVFLSNT